MQLPFGISAEIVELLRQAACEISRLDGPDNDVCRRLQAFQHRLVPLSTAVGELARRLDIAPRDVLDAALSVGIRPFWHDGQQFRDPAYLKAFLRLQFHRDPVPELQFDLSLGMAQRLAEELGVSRDELFLGEESSESSTPALKAPRKFVASESQLPDAAQFGNRHERTG